MTWQGAGGEGGVTAVGGAAGKRPAVDP